MLDEATKRQQMEEAKKRLEIALPNIGLALEMAKVDCPAGSKVMLGIIIEYPDQRGKIACRFDDVSFLRDVVVALGMVDE